MNKKHCNVIIFDAFQTTEAAKTKPFVPFFYAFCQFFKHLAIREKYFSFHDFINFI